MNLPEPVGVGYFPKATRKRPDWLKAAGVEEICSVSECMSKGPEDWIQKWLHNELGFFDSEALARRVAAGDATFELYAYRLYPLRFDEGAVAPWNVPYAVDLDLTGYRLLGYDSVSRSISDFFECSPLSCNHAATEFPVNRYCLSGDPATGHATTLAISRATYEPGPYYLLEVHRREPG